LNQSSKLYDKIDHMYLVIDFSIWLYFIKIISDEICTSTDCPK